MKLYRKKLLGLFEIRLIRGKENGSKYNLQDNCNYYLYDYAIVYKFMGIIFHSVTVSGLTIEEAKNLIK